MKQPFVFSKKNLSFRKTIHLHSDRIQFHCYTTGGETPIHEHFFAPHSQAFKIISLNIYNVLTDLKAVSLTY